MAPQTLSTAAVAPHERLDYWRDVICDVFVPLSAEPNGTASEEFTGAVRISRVDELQLVRVDSVAQRVRRAPTDDVADCLVSVQLRGRGVVAQGDHEARLLRGDLALYDATRPYELRFDDAFSQLVLQFPRRALTHRGVDPAAVVARAVPGRGAVSIATTLLERLWRDGGDVGDDLHPQLAGQALDLLALALAPTGGGADRDRERTAWRRRALAHVEDRLDDPTLSVTDVARRLGVSRRYLQQLFAETGDPLGARIRRARMTRARILLATAPHLSVADVAACVGYRDRAHFSRAFARYVGAPPSTLR